MLVSSTSQSVSSTNNFFSSTWRAFERSYHQFIPTLNRFSSHSWNKFQGLFTTETKETKYLRELLKMEAVDWQIHKEKLAKILVKSSPHSRQGHLLRILLKRCDTVSLKEILHFTFDEMFESSRDNFEKVLKFLDVKKVNTAACSKTFMEEIKEMADCLPTPTAQKTNSVESEIKKTLGVVIKFFPNFMDTLLKAFNLIEAGKGPETIWDFAAMMEIYFKIFMIPHGVFVIVGAVVSVPWQMFLITGGFVLAAVVGICLYLKYRPCPNKLPRANNLTEKAIQGKLEPVVGREKEIQEIGTYLGKKKDGILTNLILVGEPGVGKTELVNGVAQQFREKRIFSLSATELAGGYTSVGDKLRLIFLDIKGHEDKVVFFIDEFGDAIKKSPQVNIAGFLKPLLGPSGVQVIAAVTSQEYKEQILTDDALQDRFTKIPVNPLTKEQILKILQKRMDHKGKSVRFEPKVAEEILNQTEEMSQPRNSVKLLNLAINRVRAFDIGKYVSQDLLEARNRMEKKQKAYQYALDHGRQEKSKIAQDIKELKSEINTLSDKTKETRALAGKVRRLISKQLILKRERNTLAKGNPKNSKLPFLHWILLPWIEAKVKEKIGNIKDIPMQVDSHLIHQIQKEWKDSSSEGKANKDVGLENKTE